MTTLGDSAYGFLQQGAQFSLTNERELKLHSQLPMGVYEVQNIPFRGYVLTPKEPRPLPPKLYGSLVSKYRNQAWAI